MSEKKFVFTLVINCDQDFSAIGAVKAKIGEDYLIKEGDNPIAAFINDFVEDDTWSGGISLDHINYYPREGDLPAGGYTGQHIFMGQATAIPRDTFFQGDGNLQSHANGAPRKTLRAFFQKIIGNNSDSNQKWTWMIKPLEGGGAISAISTGGAGEG